MQPVLVDSNIILDILTEDETWFEWSADQIEQLAEKHLLAINPIIYAEISTCFENIEELEAAVPASDFARLHLPLEAAFLAGKIFLQYKKNNGTKTSTMPDFFIGAHAMIKNMILLTRDVKRYKTYFPKLSLITPEFEIIPQ